VKLRYSPRATRDLAEIAEYLTARSRKGALSVERRIRKTIDLISEFPGAGRRLDQRPAVRVVPLGRYPYLVPIHFATMKSSSSMFGTGRENPSIRIDFDVYGGSAAIGR
jgi:plasmid stabilization system protein ParE